MQAKYWNHDGIPVTDKEIPSDEREHWMKSQEHLTDAKLISKQEYEGMVAADEAKKTKKEKSKPLTNGDFVDAIMDQMNLDRLAGKEMGAKMDAALADWLKIPKESE